MFTYDKKALEKALSYHDDLNDLDDVELDKLEDQGKIGIDDAGNFWIDRKKNELLEAGSVMRLNGMQPESVMIANAAPMAACTIMDPEDFASKYPSLSKKVSEGEGGIDDLIWVEGNTAAVPFGISDRWMYWALVVTFQTCPAASQ